MPNPCASLPTSLTAGDTLEFTRSLPLFPASGGWQLKYVIVGTGAVYAFAATASGDDYTVTIAAAYSAAWDAGRYKLQESVTSGDNTQRYSIGTTPLLIQPNLAALTSGTGPDLRTHAQKMLDSIEEYLERRTPTTMLIIIDGKRLEKYPLPEILAMRDRYRAEVAMQGRVQSGRHGLAKVRLSF